MEEYRDTNENEHKSKPSTAGPNRGLLALVAALVVTAGVALGYGYKQQILVGHLTAEEMVEKSTINQLQGQLDSLTTKLNDLTSAQAAATARTQNANSPESGKTAEKAAVPASEQTPAKKNGAVAHTKTKRAVPVDKRYQQLQAQLEEQQKQLKETQDVVAQNRAELEGNINSTRDELNGSIAKTHEELVALEKRGERSYFEFELTKSKGFEREGPVSLSLRKADTKHKSYDLEMIVDDNQLSKKKVNLYEPIWIHVENESQPVQIVVNKIDKNLIHGYVSAPKYKPSELAAAGSPSLTPAAAHPQGPDQNVSSPKQPQ